MIVASIATQQRKASEAMLKANPNPTEADPGARSAGDPTPVGVGLWGSGGALGAKGVLAGLGEKGLCG